MAFTWKISTWLVLCGALFCFTEIQANSNITFSLSARNLTAFDPFGGYPDPYVIITYENPPNSPFPLGETSILDDTQEAVWPEIFNVIHVNGTSTQRIILEVYDEDVDSDDLMGSVVVQLDEIVASFGGILEREILLNNSTINGLLTISANITIANA